MAPSTTILTIAWLLPALCQSQTTDILGQLETLGVQFLSGVLATPSTSSPSSTTSSTTSTTSSTAASTSASPTSNTESITSTLNRPVAASSASATAASTMMDHEPKNRKLAIILGTVLGFLVLVLLLALLWLCCRRRRRNKGAKAVDDDDLDAWKKSEMEGLGTSYVTRIESWHEPRGSRSSSRGPPRGSQSRVSVVQRDVPDRYNSDSEPPIPLPPPHRVSQYGLIQNEDPFDDVNQPQPAYKDRPNRHSMDELSKNPNKYPGYAPYRPQGSTQSLVDRTPTPLFGSGKTPGESSIKRKSVGSGISNPADRGLVHPADRGYSQDPTPVNHSNVPYGNDQTHPLPRNPGRRRESMPGSPLAHEFNFGFDENGHRRASNGRPSMPGTWHSSNFAEAHQRF